jgi:hypothetical protein
VVHLPTDGILYILFFVNTDETLTDIYIGGYTFWDLCGVLMC